MHRMLLGVTDHRVEIDHIDGDGLNNRRANLRTATRAQNARNMMKSRGRSRFKGVDFHKLTNKWRARIVVNYVERFIGLFGAEEAAARAYDQAARKAFGKFARLNFPEAV